MHWIKVENPNRLVVKSYPLALVSIVVAMVIIFTIAALAQSNSLQFIGFTIFYGVTLGFISFHRSKRTVFDKSLKKCEIYERNLFQKRQFKISWNDLGRFEMSYGKGSGHARGGVLELITKDDTYQIIGSDIQMSHERKTLDAKKRIETFLET